MREQTATSTALLEGLKDPRNQTLWGEYVSRHRPLIVGYCTRLGIPPADAEDVAQEALIAFAGAYREGRYQPGRGRLRAWMHGIVHNVAQRWFRGRQRRGDVQPAESQGGTGFFAKVADPRDAEQVWDEEWRQAVLRTALDRARGEFEASTFAAFERFACQGEAADAVAAALGTTRNAVYLAKHRVLKRLRELTEEVEQLWA